MANDNLRQLKDIKHSDGGKDKNLYMHTVFQTICNIGEVLESFNESGSIWAFGFGHDHPETANNPVFFPLKAKVEFRIAKLYWLMNILTLSTELQITWYDSKMMIQPIRHKLAFLQFRVIQSVLPSQYTLELEWRKVAQNLFSWPDNLPNSKLHSYETWFPQKRTLLFNFCLSTLESYKV